MTKRKILFVDDEPNVTAALKRALRREPYEVRSAVSAEEGMKILEREEIDVIVSDEQMPGMPGSEFLAQVRCKYPRTIRMILTGQASIEAAIRAINEGEVYRFFTKPCNEVDLKVTIRQALHQRDLASQSRRLLDACRQESSDPTTSRLERENPGITQLRTDRTGAIIVDAVEEDVDQLLKQMEEEIQARTLRAARV